MNDMTETMIETIKENMLQCFNQLREYDSIHEPNFSLRSILDINAENKVKYTVSPKINAPIVAPKTDLRRKINSPISFPQPNEFKEREKYKGTVSTHVDK